MSRIILASLIVAVCCSVSSAQGIRKKKAAAAKRLLDAASRSEDSSTNRRSDVEGTIWEYKVLDSHEKNKSKQTKMTGRIRIKQSAIFAVGKVVLSNQDDPESGESSDSDDSDGATTETDVKAQVKNLVSERLKQAESETTGGERVGDLSKSRQNEHTFRFDEDDEYPLSGIVVVKPDTKKQNGVWIGRYDEFSNGRKKKRWRIEMRKIEE